MYQYAWPPGHLSLLLLLFLLFPLLLLFLWIGLCPAAAGEA